jgi:hypothetical protein
MNLSKFTGSAKFANVITRRRTSAYIGVAYFAVLHCQIHILLFGEHVHSGDWNNGKKKDNNESTGEALANWPPSKAREILSGRANLKRSIILAKVANEARFANKRDYSLALIHRSKGPLSRVGIRKWRHFSHGFVGRRQSGAEGKVGDRYYPGLYNRLGG